MSDKVRVDPETGDYYLEDFYCSQSELERIVGYKRGDTIINKKKKSKYFITSIGVSTTNDTDMLLQINYLPYDKRCTIPCSRKVTEFREKFDVVKRTSKNK